MTIRASSRGASERFYETVLHTLGVHQTHSDEQFAEWDDFSLSQSDGKNPVTRRVHVTFVAPSREHVDAFWRVGTDAGYRDDGARPARARSTAPTTTVRSCSTRIVSSES